MDFDLFARWLRQAMPVLDSPQELPAAVEIVDSADSEFCASLRLDAEMVAATCFHGYMPMGHEVAGIPLLLIKVHSARSVLAFADLHTSASTLRRARGLRLEINRDFEGCLRATVAAHPDRWLVEPLCRSLASLHEEPRLGVRTHSIEVYDDSRLLAGEIGYVCGAVYTSLSGFHTTSGSGSVQLACLGRILASAGFGFWDLGMDLAYKRRLGARVLGREEFLDRYRSARGIEVPLPPGPFDCARLLRGRECGAKAP